MTMMELTVILVSLMTYLVQLCNNPSGRYRNSSLIRHYDTPINSTKFTTIPSKCSRTYTMNRLSDYYFRKRCCTTRSPALSNSVTLCIRTSATLAAFCRNILAAPPELEDIHGLDMFSIKHLLLHVELLHMHLDDMVNGVPVLQYPTHIIL